MLKDLQNEQDNRNIFISNIGICDYKLPISIKIGDKVYNSICIISSNVALGKENRGAHLSRIIEVLNDCLYEKEITLEDINKITKETKSRSATLGVDLNMAFDIILERITPVSNKKSYTTANLKINNAEIGEESEKSLSISLYGTMLCPCSKEISKYGAHNQKCKATISLYGNYESVNLDDIIHIMESSFSANVYSTVKREDEKYITEKAYENALFSEDLIRNLLLGVSEIYDEKIVAEIINYESIHEHNVYARGILDGKANVRSKKRV